MNACTYAEFGFLASAVDDKDYNGKRELLLFPKG
jgi:hypothetical protein